MKTPYIRKTAMQQKEQGLDKIWKRRGKQPLLFQILPNPCSFCCIAVFLIHVGTWPLLWQMPKYIEKKHYHVGKKIANVGYFNLTMFWLEHLSLVENTVKYIHFQDQGQEINAL